MRYLALATDYDETLAHHGQVTEKVLSGLARFGQSGRRLLLVTGRRLPDLISVFPALSIFDGVVAENGAMLYFPKAQEKELIAQPPPAPLLDALNRLKVPFVPGEVIIATWEPYQAAIVQAIREAGLEYEIIFNKGNAMILPPGINKASGLKALLERINLDFNNVVAVGDAENDHALLSSCGLGAAVANALPSLKNAAGMVLEKETGEGVLELLQFVMKTDPPGN